MKYKCENCRRQFEFDDVIEFCPYCGKQLDDSLDTIKTLMSDTGLAQEISSIWGEKAHFKSEFSRIISQCISLINNYIENSIAMALPKQDLTEYDKHYSTIKQSNNRKTLVSRIDCFMDSLECVIENLNDYNLSDTSNRLKNTVYDVKEVIKELYDFLGIQNTLEDENGFPGEIYSIEVLYTREQLHELYNLVLAAYSKYKKCVEDNNMFAAFASTSNYGALAYYRNRYFNSFLDDNNNDDVMEGKEIPQYDQVIKYMKKHNAEKYFGILDEDFVPHVDAFWYGLEMLCVFIDHHIAVKCETDYFFIDEDERAKLHRVILPKEFDVSESRLQSAIEFKNHIEIQLEKLNEKQEEENLNEQL